MRKKTQLSIPQRDLLIEHLDVAVPVSIRLDRYRNQTLRSLVEAGLVTYSPICGGAQGPIRPKETRITDAGRTLVSRILADCADVLARATEIQDRRNYERSAFGPLAAPGP